MNPDGGGFAGWAICKVQGPSHSKTSLLQQGGLERQWRLDSGTDKPGQRSGGYQHHLVLVVCLGWARNQQRTRIAGRAAHRPSNVSSNEMEGPGERAGRRERDQAERPVCS